MSAPDGIEPILGYRVFALDADGVLASPSWRQPRQRWHTGPNTAVCHTPRTTINWLWGHNHRPGTPVPAPSGECGCGLYACHSLDALARRYPRFRSAHGSRLVVAAVRAWGQIEVHEDGWRAEHAQLVAIGYRDQAERERLQPVAARYGVPLVAHALLPQMATAHGVPLSPQLLPDPQARDRRTGMQPRVMLFALYVLGAVVMVAAAIGDLAGAWERGPLFAWLAVINFCLTSWWLWREFHGRGEVGVPRVKRGRWR